jgi:hypothetical protein
VWTSKSRIPMVGHVYMLVVGFDGLDSFAGLNSKGFLRLIHRIMKKHLDGFTGEHSQVKQALSCQLSVQVFDIAR